jgi:hypothetical protein
MLRIKHQVDNRSGHSHTTLTIEQDDEGRFWLFTKCDRYGCKGEVLLELLPAQVEQWQKLGVWEGEKKEDAA